MSKQSLSTWFIVICVSAAIGKGDLRTTPEATNLFEEQRLELSFRDVGMLSSVENGYAVFRQSVAGKSDTERVHIYNLQKRSYLTIEPHSFLPEAEEVNLYGISVGRSGAIAISANAVAGSDASAVVANIVMVFDEHGRMLRARSSTEPGEEIIGVEIDSDNTIWGLSRGSRRADTGPQPGRCP